MGRYETQGDRDLSADALWKIVRSSGDVGWLPGSPKPEWEGEGPGVVRVVDLGGGRSRAVWRRTGEPDCGFEAEAGKRMEEMSDGVLGFLKKTPVAR